MQNDFEKQVQQKMEELKLVPSEPVWQRVELQIRQKKDRRRLFFWLPLAVLLIGAGLWYAGYESSKATSSDDTRSQTQTQQPGNVALPSRKLATDNNKPTTARETKNDFQDETTTQPRIEQTSVSKNFEPLTTGGIRSPNKTFQRNNQRKENSSVIKETTPAETEERVVLDENPQRQLVTPVGKANTDTTSVVKPNSNTTATTEVEPKKTEVAVPKDSTALDSSLIRKPAVKKFAQSKWKYAVVAGLGVSGSGRIDFFNGQKSLAYAPAGPQAGGNFPPRYGPSEVDKGLSFSFGGNAERPLSSRTSFSAGLLYSYYSNTINVGSMVVQNTVLRDYAVSQYYSNIGANNSYVSLKPYRNRYHFISVPLSFKWQLLKKLPVNFETDLSLQYLIQTNGLVFDHSRQAYFHNEKAFNRLQFFSGLGLNYSLPFEKNTISFGPEVKYGLSRLEKDNSEYHLFSYGLKAQFQFNRK